MQPWGRTHEEGRGPHSAERQHGASTHLAGDLEQKQTQNLDKSLPDATVRPSPFSFQAEHTSDLASSTGSLN